jgi:hypothetical protein
MYVHPFFCLFVTVWLPSNLYYSWNFIFTAFVKKLFKIKLIGQLCSSRMSSIYKAVTKIDLKNNLCSTDLKIIRVKLSYLFVIRRSCTRRTFSRAAKVGRLQTICLFKHTVPITTFVERKMRNIWTIVCKNGEGRNCRGLFWTTFPPFSR